MDIIEFLSGHFKMLTGLIFLSGAHNKAPEHKRNTVKTLIMNTSCLDSPGQKLECRVLQVFSCLGVGGAETWLLALLKYFEQAKDELPVRIRFNICLTGGRKSEFDDEASSLGARLFYLHYCRRNLPAFIREFRSILSNGRYHAIHDHQDYTSGLHFLFGMGHLPPVRIAHVHNPLLHIDSYSSSFLRKLTIATGKQLLSYLATHIMGTSLQVVSEYGFDDARFSKVKLGAAHCGFDVSRFTGDYKRSHRDICSEFGWEETVKILLFVGRLGSSLNQKNPAFALDVVKAVISKNPDARLLMAGGEGAMTALENKVKEWGLQKKIRLIGLRADVPRLMSGSDLFLLTSLGEGLGMVAVEAQASGLWVLVSDTTPRECEVVPGMVKFMPLDTGPSAWADEALRLLNALRPDQAACNLAVKNSPFSIENSAANLFQMYTAGSVNRANKGF